jgi:hypothetical protein
MIVIDDFLSNEMCEEIISDALFFPKSMGDDERIASGINSYHNEQSDCFAPYMFWEGWEKSPPKTVRQKVVMEIWKDNLPFSIDEVCGFEYWTRTFNAGQYLGPHVDEDTFRYASTKILTGPRIGCVYYGPETDAENGGFLEIYPDRIDDFSSESLESSVMGKMLVPIDQRERIACKANRLIIFDSGHVIHGTSPAKSGKRNVMVINVWNNDIRPVALETGEFYYE